MNSINPNDISGYKWDSAAQTSAHSYLLPLIFKEMASLQTVVTTKESPRAFDLGCGNGSIANALTLRGWEVSGVDPSSEGIAQAKNNYPHLNLREGSAYDELSCEFGQFPVVYSLEVVEHVYFPRHYIQTLFSLLEPGGTAIVSTPYHGYWKNLALALTGKMDNHFTALWDHGHIKFWSKKTLTALLLEAGFKNIRFELVGRIPALAKSMVVIAEKP
jgi:2-polyprenyl-6-hydroxyphenyl methylase/3-demethylubiquinone-9 3-methyltransferase